MIWNGTHETATVIAALIVAMTVTLCTARDAVGATVLPNGNLELSEAEIKHCNDGGGCKLINEYQITILIHYIEQLKREIEIFTNEQEVRKLKVCI